MQFQQCLALLEEIKAKCISLKKFKIDANAALEKTEKQLKIPQSYSEAVERLNREDHLPILAQPLQGQVSYWTSNIKGFKEDKLTSAAPK